MRDRRGFSLVELLAVIAIIAVLGTIVTVALYPVRQKARDTKRKTTVAQIGRFFSLSCFMPSAGAGDYDLADIFGEVKAVNPQYANIIPNIPKDPRGGTEMETLYRYQVSSDGKSCVLYANLERDDERVALDHLTAPTPGGGSGILRASTEGWHGSDLYIQASN